MTKIYFCDYEGEHGEAQAMYNEDGSLIDMWFSNDGNWRGEYFDGFLRKLGITIDYSGKFSSKFAEHLENLYA